VKRAPALAGAAAALLSAALAAGPVSVIDDSGTRIALSQPARRVVALSPALTELAFAAGGGDRLVGADSASDYPAASRSLPRVGDAAGIDLERIIAMRPDLVLAWLSGNKPTDVARLRQLSIPVYLSEPRTLDDVPRSLRVMGTLLGSENIAGTQAIAFERRVAALRAGHAHSRAVSVFVEIWHQPLMTVNGTHLVTDVLRACGARNIFADLQALAGPVSLERLLASNPDVILSATGFEEDMGRWQRLRSLDAVRNAHVLRVDPDHLTRATPRILDAVEQICDWLERTRVASVLSH
jgi:iron complex transport system substrate-binding protein